jgi:hypothetical protein
LNPVEPTMTIEYKIDETDYLTQQLFLASKSERIKKKRQRNKVLLPLVSFIFGLLFFFIKKNAMTVQLFIIGILWFFVYPHWERRLYVNHYKKFIKENYKDRLGKAGTLEIENEFIFAKEDGMESKVLTTELDVIIEIPTTIYLMLKNGQSFIIPKDKISNINVLTARLKELAEDLKIKYDIDENWVWK